MAQQIGFEISASNEQLIEVLQQSTDAIKGLAGAAGEALGPLGSAFSVLTSGVAGIGVAIGAAFAAIKTGVSTTATLASSSIQLGNQLGIGATKASQLKIALDELGLTQEQVGTAANAVTRALNQHEQAFQQVGVATRDANGNFRSTMDILLDSLTVLSNFKEGTDRNVEGARLFGRAWGEVAPLVRLNASAMADAAQEAQALGLSVGQEQVSAFLRYQSAMASVKAVIEGAANTIGQAFMPILTSFGEWMRSVGPQVVQAFRQEIADTTREFLLMKEGIGIAVDYISASFQALETRVGMVISTMNRALRGDWAGAKAAWEAGSAQLDKLVADLQAKVAARMQQTKAAIAAAYAQPTSTPVAPIGDNTAGDQAPKDRMKLWQEELAERKATLAQEQAAEGQFHEFSKTDEIAFWQEILATTSTNANEKVAIRRQIANLEIGIAKDSFDAQLASLKEQEAQYKNNLDARLAIAKQYEAKVAAAYGTDSKQYADVAKEVVAIERQKVEQLNAIDQQRRAAAQSTELAQVDAEEASAQQELSLHMLTDEQFLEQEKKFEDQRYEIKLASMQRELALAKDDPDANPTQVAKINAQIEALTQQHASKMQSIDNKLVLQQKQAWTSMFNTIEQAFSSNISKMLEGTESFKAGMQNIAKAIGDGFIQTFVQIGVKAAATWLANKILAKGSADDTIAGLAGQAGAAGVASFAAAPWPIDIGAPAFGLAMASAAAGFGAAASAAEGFDVPAGMNPVTQLHASEMVLPAPLANVIRGMASDGGGGGGRGGSEGHTFNINAIDSRSVKDMLRSQRGTIAKTLRDYGRRRR